MKPMNLMLYNILQPNISKYNIMVNIYRHKHLQRWARYPNCGKPCLSLNSSKRCLGHCVNKAITPFWVSLGVSWWSSAHVTLFAVRGVRIT